VNIIGISAYYHDSAAALVCDGKIIAAAQEERFTRKKFDASFPVNAIKYCLDSGCLEMDDIDSVVFYDKPFLKFERLLETYYSYIPSGIASFVTSMPVWAREKLFLKSIIDRELKKIGSYNISKQKLLFPSHHLSHAASAFYTSSFEQAVIVTIDGVGEWTTASICLGQGNKLKLIKELLFPHSVGLLYSSFTYFLGFRVNSGEYKLMGLAPYGELSSERVKKYIRLIKDNILEIRDDGSIWLNQHYFSYATGLRMIKTKRWEELFGFSIREPEGIIEQHHCDLALAIQLVTEEIVKKMVFHARTFAENDEQSKYLCMAGGVALNCVANGKILAKGWFEDIYIQPAAGDAGGALGAALAGYHVYAGMKRSVTKPDSMNGSFLGPEFEDKEIVRIFRRYKAAYRYVNQFGELTTEVARLLSEGKIVGWFQGRMEFGPRALGNRSILSDARYPEMQKRLNLKIKYRESFRPFAPAVLAEDKDLFFNLKTDSPYMLLIGEVNEDRCNMLPENYHSLPPMERLYIQRSDIPAVTHIDFTARVQTVHKETNERFWLLIDAYKSITGYGIIVNTSFNVRGEPIVCSPEDAYKCFMNTEMDYLVIGDFLLAKEEQPVFNNRGRQKEMALD
jgi:carbamoyltransferase